ncbi:hypothetical protein RA28_18110 [Ruegeria sp. ANG-S4]|nr:hypothetical protein RA28_18110 [Ruegeria sp. ANG-S4]
MAPIAPRIHQRLWSFFHGLHWSFFQSRRIGCSIRSGVNPFVKAATASLQQKRADQLASPERCFQP